MFLQVPAYRIRQCLWLLFFVALFFLAGTSFYHENFRQYPVTWQKLLISQLSLAIENVAAAWFSSMMLLMAGCLALGAYRSDVARFGGGWQQVVSVGWLCTAAVFFLLSFDEMGSVHETIGDSAPFALLSNGSGWFLFQILVGLVGVLMVVFGWMRLRRVPLALALFFAGVLLYLSNPFQENFEIASFNAAADPLQWKRPLFFLLLEEGSELAGSACFIGAGVVYLTRASKQMGYKGIRIVLGSDGAVVLRILWALLGAGALVLFFMSSNQPHQTETGIGQNWFPSAVAFVLFGATVYYGFRAGIPKTQRIFFALVALLALSISVAAGIDFFGHAFTHHPIFRGGLVAACLLMFVLLFWLWQPAWQHGAKWSLLLWLAFTASSIFLPQPFAVLFFYSGVGSLLVGLSTQCRRQPHLSVV